MDDVDMEANLPPLNIARPYQQELLEYIVEKNGIIYLPTNAGKTYVAVSAIKHFSHQLQNTIEEGGKRSIFMCNTVELARQQAVVLKKSTNLKIGFYVGERDVDNWHRSTWSKEIQEHQVFVGTAQVFLNMVTQGHIKITDLSVVVVDECHHAKGSHPMHEFMRMFQFAEDQSQLPRVIGLTGVLLTGNKLDNIKKDLIDFEAKYRGNIVTVSSMEQYNNVLVYATNPHELGIYFDEPVDTHPLILYVKRKVDGMLRDIDSFDLGPIPQKMSKGLASIREPNKKNNVKNLLKDFLYQLDDFGIYAAGLAITSVLVQFELKKRSSETLVLRTMYRNMIKSAENIKHLIYHEVFKYNRNDVEMSADTIIKFSTPKMNAFFNFLQHEFPGKNRDDISALVFVERRYTAKCLFYTIADFIKATPDLKNVIFPDFIVGRNTIQSSMDTILENKWSKEVVENFRNKKCNMIICSSVLEEGIDIQACNYVIALDRLKTFNSYIQTKGRARSSGSKYVMFIPRAKHNEVLKQVAKYNIAHKEIKEFLVGRILYCEEPNDNEIARQFNDAIPTFTTNKSARLIGSMALTLLTRYCQTLPTDSFGIVLPSFKIISTVTDNVIVGVDLPLQSPLRERIFSAPMITTKIAKQSAAFNACVKLYECGELNDHLLPVTKKECISKVADDLFSHWKDFEDDIVNTKTQGANQRRIYDRLCPEELYGALPVVGQKCYIYEITTSPCFPENDYTSHIYNQLKGTSSYAFCLSKRLPLLAEMPLFMHQGELRVKIAGNPIEVCLTSEQELEDLIKFHQMIFRDLLDVWKCFFASDRRNKEHSFLLIPLNNKQIDWDLVRTFPKLTEQRELSVQERMSKVYRPEDYLGKVVNKWYLGSANDRYVVTKVHTNKSPLTEFTDGGYKSYKQFYETKYGYQIERVVNNQQFLLEVQQYSHQTNFLLNDIIKQAKKAKTRNPALLLPELVHNFMYPGEMYLKAMLLPSILQRVEYMLHAETIRKRVIAYLGLKSLAPYQPKPLFIDTSLKRVADMEGNATEAHEPPPNLLPSLPTTPSQSSYMAHPIITHNYSTKAFEDPIDTERKTQTVYSVDLSYYHNFTKNYQDVVDALEELDLNAESSELWTKSQLDMEEIGIMPGDSANPYSSENRLSLCDVPATEKSRIEILENSCAHTLHASAEQNEYLAALTTASATDIFDMERYELIGDSFLKFSMSLFLVHKYPKWHEGFLTVIKSQFVSNRNLLYCMLRMDLKNRICSNLFQPRRNWVPPLATLPINLLEYLEENPKRAASLAPSDLYGIELTDEEVRSGVMSKESMNQVVSHLAPDIEGYDPLLDSEVHSFRRKVCMVDKAQADTLEAVLGVCVKNYGIFNGFRMLEFFGICKPEAGQSLTGLLDLKLGGPLLRANISQKEVDGFLVNHQHLERNLGYTFKDRSYLLQALTHPSFPTNRLTGCYQELEFIGDAILDFLVSCYIFEKHKNMPPGQLTDFRSALVNNITLACICVRHKFHLFLRYENSILAESITTFADFQRQQKYRVTDQVRILMEEDDPNVTLDGQRPVNIAADIDVPKTLGDVVEALIAAVYLDCRDIKVTWNVIYGLLRPEFEQFQVDMPIDPVRQLFEHPMAKPVFDAPIVGTNGSVIVTCNFTCLKERVETSGVSSNTVTAKKAAAKHALQILKKYT